MFKIEFEIAHCMSCPFCEDKQIEGIVIGYFCTFCGKQIDEDDIYNLKQLPIVCPFEV